MTRELKATACIFKRTQKSKWEQGIAIGDVDIIIDSKSQTVVETVWSYELMPTQGCFIIHIDED